MSDKLTDQIRRTIARAILDEAEWIESNVAGLLAAGVAPAEIEIRRWQDEPGRVAIAVRGESRFEYRTELVSIDSLRKVGRPTSER